MTREQFWEIVAAVRWEHGTEFERGKEILIGLLPDVETMKAFSSHFSDVRSQLVVAVQEWEREWTEIGTGDDGFSDLTCHVVGLGEKTWEASIANPRLVWNRADAPHGSEGSYRESFSYCIPDEEDYFSEIGRASCRERG